MRAAGIVMIADAGIVGMRTGNVDEVTVMSATGVAMDITTSRVDRALTRGKDLRQTKIIKRDVVSVYDSSDARRFWMSVDALNSSSLISHAP